MYLLLGALATGVMLGLNAFGSMFQPGESFIPWQAVFLQVVNLPLCFLWFAISQERKTLRHRPRRVSGPAGKLEIRSKSEGKVIAIVDGEILRGASFEGANLQSASLWGEQLEGANLSGTNLQGAYLRGAVLDGADLSRANLQGANLVGASLCSADLRGADLRNASMGNADLTGAIYDRSTRWGLRTKQKQRRCVLVEGDCGGFPLPAAAPTTDLDTLPVPAGVSQALQSALAAGASNPGELPPVRTR